MASGGMWTASSSVGNAACSWPQEALNSSTGSFNPISKWRILRSVFNCTRLWRYVGRQAQNVRVRYTLELQYRSIEVNQDMATSDLSYRNPTLPRNMPVKSGKGGGSLRESKQCGKARHGCSNSQDLILFNGHFLKPCMILFPQSNCTPGTTLAIVAFAVVALSLECDQYPTDHVDWGGLGTSYLFGTPLESKNACVSIVTFFQAASILLFQAAYFWLKFREASTSSGRKRKVSDLLSCDSQSSRGVYARPIKDKVGNVVGHKYEPRFKPPRERNAQGKVLSFQNLPLASYNNPRDAEIVRQIAAFYYNKDTDLVSLGDGGSFRIPAINLHGLSGNEKAKWVSEEAKKVFEKYCNPNGQPQSGNDLSVHTSFHTSPLNHYEFPQTSPDQLAHASLPDHAGDEQFNTIAGWDIEEFLLEESPEDVVPGKRVLESLHQSQGIVGKLAYCQLQPHCFETPSCNTITNRQSLSDIAAGQSCLQFQSSEGSSKWGMDVLTSEAAAVHASVPISRSTAMARATLSLRTSTNFCSGNCVTDLLQEVVNRQQKQIEELKRANEFLKSTSGLKTCSFCCESPLY